MPMGVFGNPDCGFTFKFEDMGGGGCGGEGEGEGAELLIGFPSGPRNTDLRCLAEDKATDYQVPIVQ